MAQTLESKKIAIVATNGFEWSELTEPREALEKEGAEAQVVSPETGEITGESKGETAGIVPVDMDIKDVSAAEYDALLLPGGVKNPDTLRMNEDVVKFVRDFAAAGKPIAAICHGPWTLINAGAVSGKRMTSWPSLQKDLENAGATWTDDEVVVDGLLVTSRKPGDIPAFNREMIKLFSGS